MFAAAMSSMRLAAGETIFSEEVSPSYFFDL
jgi:hypothetical protein